jgi:hypothetical protein
MKNWIIIILIATVAVLIFFRFPKSGGQSIVTVEYRSDTIVRIDTVKIEVPKPYKVTEVRTDTLFIYVDRVLNPGDSVPVELPIEEVGYKGEEYELTIGGYRPYLKNLTVYPRTVTIDNTVTNTITKRPRFGVGIQAGYGITGKEISPYIGVGVQYNLFSF